MALSRVKTWTAEILTASDLNAEFNNILNNALSLISPLTGNLDMNGTTLIIDADADTSLKADSDDRIDITIGGTISAYLGHDTTNSGSFFLFDPLAFTSQANTNVARVKIGGSNALTVPAGTTAIAAGLHIAEPNFTATGTITSAATVYIADAPSEGGTNNYALWVDSGATQLDGNATVGGTLGVTGVQTNSAQVIWAKGSDVASAGALTLGTDGNYFDITGTTTITSIGTLGVGTWVRLHFDDALTLTHHATNLILPSGANITTAAGDEAEFVEYGSGTWRCTNYTAATGKPVAGGGIKVDTFSYDISTATGTQAITGTGFTPRAVIFFANVTTTAQMSMGAADASDLGSVSDNNGASTDTYISGATDCIAIRVSGGNNAIATISSFDADGFTLSWTKSGSPTGTATIIYVAFE